jgi:hypothetical protein
MTCVADPDNIDAYPDPNFYSDEDPDPIICIFHLCQQGKYTFYQGLTSLILSGLIKSAESSVMVFSSHQWCLFWQREFQMTAFLFKSDPDLRACVAGLDPQNVWTRKSNTENDTK